MSIVHHFIQQSGSLCVLLIITLFHLASELKEGGSNEAHSVWQDTESHDSAECEGEIESWKLIALPPHTQWTSPLWATRDSHSKPPSPPWEDSHFHALYTAHVCVSPRRDQIWPSATPHPHHSDIPRCSQAYFVYIWFNQVVAFWPPSKLTSRWPLPCPLPAARPPRNRPLNPQTNIRYIGWSNQLQTQLFNLWHMLLQTKYIFRLQPFTPLRYFSFSFPSI